MKLDISSTVHPVITVPENSLQTNTDSIRLQNRNQPVT